MKKILWTPSDAQREASVIWDFMRFVSGRTGKEMDSYETLYSWSVEEPAAFWESVWDYFDIIGDKGDGFAGGETPRFIEMDWFPGARLNYAENMLRFMEGGQDGIVFYGENQVVRRLSRDDVRTRTLSFALALREAGIGAGDVVAGYMPNLPETVIAMLGTAAAGAIWCSCATDVGASVAVDRIGQTRPKLLVTADGYYYKGRIFETAEHVKEITEAVDSIERVILCSYTGGGLPGDIPNVISWDEFTGERDTAAFAYERYGFSHPLFIMFSSGTTGKPKCMVQSAMGLLLNQLKELAIMSDIKASDRLLYITTCSWMMWNWQAAALGTGAALVLYDGNPSWPGPEAIWKVLETEKVSVFGLSASYIHMLLNLGFSPGKEADLSALREISQTGSSLSDDGFDYIYREIKEDLFFSSIAGGTDINGCFCMGSPIRPVWSSELQGPALGMKINCYDDEGKPVRDTEGELVCESPAPCMPIRFWNDDDGSKYRAAYFDVFPGVWRHGDYVIFDSKTGGVSFRGRSDSVLKPSGVRIGTAEIYNQVEKLPEIEDSLVIGQDHNGDQRVILFVKLNPEYSFTDELQQKIRKTLREEASPRHVPAMIFPVSDIPVTMNGKKVESAVTNLMNGRDVTNRNALANPDSLELYEKIRDEIAADDTGSGLCYTNPGKTERRQPMKEFTPVKEGKVREIYDNGDSLIMVATDRISAFDVILKNKIEKKGTVLTQMSKFWFDFTKDIVPNHMISVDVNDMPEFFRQDRFNGNSMMCRKLTMLPIECIVRGYITGSGWASYQKNGTVCGITLPEGLQESQQLPEPIYTPSTKAEIGDHDENISYEQSIDVLEKEFPGKGEEYARKLRDMTIAIYKKCADYAKSRGIIIADTKFEFGLDEDGNIVLGDEVLTPDSSRFWPLEGYEPGKTQPSYDKQFVRDWLKANPDSDYLLPQEIIDKTIAKYIEAYEKLTGSTL